MGKSAIVVIGYNNPGSLARLLDSLAGAYYGNDTVPLIISLDYSGNSAVERIAKEFQWRHGKKEIRIFEKRQGLKKHVLSCGEYFQEYDALYIFEDDTLVAESYYKFGQACIEFYAQNEKIAGIALYNHTWNQNANFPFEPVKNQYDTYFMQYASSWGQIWLKESWQDFMSWYRNNQGLFEKEKDDCIPAMLYLWEDSWLKYHIAYCALEKKYFVYPYCSYTTVFAERGTHFTQKLTRFQVNLIQGKIEKFYLAPLDDESVCYDAFFESEQIARSYKEQNMEVKVDLYGCQAITHDNGLVLTTQNLPFEVLDEFALQLRPLDLNVLKKVEGKGIFLYDTSKSSKKLPDKKRIYYIKRWDYFMKDRFLMLAEIIPLSVVKAKNLLRIICGGGKKWKKDSRTR